jgi:hypothetical protein
MTTSVSALVLDIIRDNPLMTNDQVADKVQELLPTAKTSAASVSSIKSNAKKNGLIPPNLIAASAMAFEPEIELPQETDKERALRIRTRYETLERMANRIVEGQLPALIVSGPPGLGKSHTVEQVLEKADKDHDVLSGTVSAVGLYIALWNMKDGGVVVLDDCDDVFRDETCLNLLKAVLDSSDVRRVSWRKRANWLDELGIDDSFEFNGSVVFCTNVDFEIAIRKGSSMAPHFEALIDRSLYLSLTMRTTDDFLTRISQVAIEDKMLVNQGLTEEQAQEIMDFIVDHASQFYGLSLRLAMQIGICYLADNETWQDDIRATKMRTI